MKKKIISILLCIMLALSMVACGNTTTANNSTKSGNEVDSVTEPEKVKNKNDFEFDEATGTITKYNETKKVIQIPDKIDDVKVTSIGYGAFNCCYDFTSITIPESITSIGDRAFSECHGLESVTIPNSITSIGEGTFRNCHKLKNVTIPNSVTSIGSEAFRGCYILKNITIPNSVTSIGKVAFWSSDLTNDRDKVTEFYVSSEKVKQLLLNSGIESSYIIIKK